MRLPESMEVGKQFLGEKVFKQIMGYVKKNPEQNLEKTLDLVEKVAVLPHHKKYASDIKAHLENNQNARKYINRLINELDENVHDHLINNFIVNGSLVGVPKQQRLSQENGFNIPYTVLIDPTSKCNLNCTGCWAGAYKNHQTLSFEEVDRIVGEAKELGMYFIAMSGGEPMMWPHLEELCRKHYDTAFMIYTNGTLIDQETARWMREAGNVSPAISLEGGRDTTDKRRGEGVFDQVMTAMDHLKNNGVAFGFSITVTSENAEEVFSDEMIDLMIDKGALYGWSFHYIPIGSDPDFSLMVKPEQRSALVDRVRYLRANKPIIIADFWNDGQHSGGCIAGGRRFFHITASGDVEPCAFVHFTIDNIKGKPLTDVLASPLFKSFRESQPFSENMLRPCPLIDNPEQLREIIKESGARPSHNGAEAILDDKVASKMDKAAAAWKEKAELKWDEIN